MLFYAVAGLYNLSNDGSFAELAGRCRTSHTIALPFTPDTHVAEAPCRVPNAPAHAPLPRASRTRKPGLLQKLEQLSASPNPDTVKYASGTVEYWRKHAGSWPPP